MPDPKLQTAMEEIKAVLRKHDLGGYVLLATPTHMEYLLELSPSWTCIKPEVDGIRIRANREDFPSLEAQKKTVELSIGLVAGMADTLAAHQDIFQKLLLQVGGKLPFDHMTWREFPGETS